MDPTDVATTVCAAVGLAPLFSDPKVAATFFRGASESELAGYYAFAERSDESRVLDTLFATAHDRLAPAERRKVRRARICGLSRAERY